MNWIKRNKLFAGCLLLAMVLLGAALFYDYQSWTRNADAFDKLNGTYATLRNLTSKQHSPGNGNVDNIKIAQEQERQLQGWIRQARKYFQPIERIPNVNSGSLRSEEFGKALSRTINELQHDAAAASVALPPDYGFSFTAERNRLIFAPGSLDQLAVQLGEVKVVSEILFDARVNSLDSIQRVRVSSDDASGQQSDYIDESPITNDLAVLTPYQFTFRAFSPEIAQVLTGFESSPHGFIVKGINVQPAEGSADMAGGTVAPVTRVEPTTPAAPVVRGGLQTVLKEQLLRVTIEVEIVKLSQRN